MEVPKDSRNDMVLRNTLHGAVWQYIVHYIVFHKFIDYGEWINPESASIGHCKFDLEVYFFH